MEIPASAWRLVLDTALDAVVVMNRDGKVVEWNHNAQTVFGWPREEALGQVMADLIIPHRFRDAHARGLRRFLETGEATVLGRMIEIWGLRRGGEEFPVELSISPISEDGGLIFVGFLRDISERRRAELLREQHGRKMEALYRTISFAAEDNAFEDALRVCLEAVQKLTDWPLGQVFQPSALDPFRLLPSPIWHSTRPTEFSRFRAATEASSFVPGQGLPGRVWQTRQAEWIADVHAHPDFPRALWPGGIEIRSAVGFPVVSSNEVIAVIEFFTETRVEPDPDLLLTLTAIGQQIGRVFERRRAEQSLREHASALETEIEERRRVEERQKLLLAELNHRVKNTLAVVSAIAAHTARSNTTAEDFNKKFLARLQALSSAHSLLTARNWESVTLAELAAAIVAPHGSDQLQLKGGLVTLPPKAVLSVSLVLHELVINALKYGALSVPTGKVELEWDVHDRSAPWVEFRWKEAGVGPLAPPVRSGFGTVMIRASVQHELNGRVEVEYGNDGLLCRIAFPLENERRGA